MSEGSGRAGQISINTNGRELGQIRVNLIIESERKLGRELNLTKAAAGKI